MKSIQPMHPTQKNMRFHKKIIQALRAQLLTIIVLDSAKLKIV